MTPGTFVAYWSGFCFGGACVLALIVAVSILMSNRGGRK
jgi:hypothetical protein